MKKILFIFLGIVFVTSLLVYIVKSNLPNGHSLYLTGDEKLIGAEVFVDNKKVGVMKKQTSTQTGKDFSVGVGIDYFERKRLPRWGFYDQIELPEGDHTLVFTTVDSKKHWMHINVTSSENYIDASEKNLKGNITVINDCQTKTKIRVWPKSSFIRCVDSQITGYSRIDTVRLYEYEGEYYIEIWEPLGPTLVYEEKINSPATLERWTDTETGRDTIVISKENFIGFIGRNSEGYEVKWKI